MKFYCETTEGGHFWGIIKICHVSMNRKYKDIIKKFEGDVYVNLENGGCIYWSVDGDFHNKGTMTFNGNIEIGIEEAAKIIFGLSHSSDFYESCWEEGRYEI